MAKKRVNNRDRNIRSNHDNRANQLNPNNEAYWKSRGRDGKPSGKNNAPSKRKNKD